jgi:hypothetical protein
MDIVTGEVTEGSIVDAPVNAEIKPNKVRKPRKARATSKFVVLTGDLVEQVTTDPNIVAARKRIETAGLSGTFYIACLREEVIVETTVPTPVTKMTVKRVAR